MACISRASHRLVGVHGVQAGASKPVSHMSRTMTMRNGSRLSLKRTPAYAAVPCCECAAATRAIIRAPVITTLTTQAFPFSASASSSLRGPGGPQFDDGVVERNASPHWETSSRLPRDVPIPIGRHIGLRCSAAKQVCLSKNRADIHRFGMGPSGSLGRRGKQGFGGFVEAVGFATVEFGADGVEIHEPALEQCPRHRSRSRSSAGSTQSCRPAPQALPRWLSGWRGVEPVRAARESS